ncbi:MAG TPA: M20 family metallopeptidase [Vicinamibacterales bacterium]|jgi:glutamate carboxypeptidase
MKQLAAFCESKRGWLLETIEALARLESPSTDKVAVDLCGLELARRLRAIGGRVTLIPEAAAGDHVLADFGSSGPRTLLLGHFDTVWPIGTLDRMPVRAADGRLWGPGVFDMKSGIGLAMLAVEALAASGALPRIGVLLTTDEETGSVTSRQLIEAEARNSRAVLVLEPALPGGALKTSRAGCGAFEIEVRGRAAHAGIEPARGANALLELAEQMLSVERLQDLERGTSLTVTLAVGGTRANVVPAGARATVDARAFGAQEAERVSAAMTALRARRPGTTVTVSGGFTHPPLERTPDGVRLFEMARAVASELGHSLSEGRTGGGSDGNFTAAAGVPTLDGLGSVGDGAHAPHEHVVIDALPFRAALLAGLLTRLGNV